MDIGPFCKKCIKCVLDFWYEIIALLQLIQYLVHPILECFRILRHNKAIRVKCKVLQQNDDNLSRRDIFECHHILVEYTYLQEDYTIISRSIINIANLHFPHNRLFRDKNNVLQIYYSKKSGIPKLLFMWSFDNSRDILSLKFSGSEHVSISVQNVRGNMYLRCAWCSGRGKL